MAIAQRAVGTPEPPFGAVVARQLSVWPFAARTQRLFLLVDPSLPDASLRHGLLRAMQQAYFRSDGCSQTRSVREAALAAHYVLRHRNRDVLPLDQITAASAVAAVRGDLAFVALAGDAAAFAWHDGALSGQHGVLRLPRPLGHEADPRIALWSTPLQRLLAYAAVSAVAAVILQWAGAGVVANFAKLAATRNVATLADRLAIVDARNLESRASRLHPLPRRDVDLACVPAATRDELHDVFGSLVKRAL